MKEHKGMWHKAKEMTSDVWEGTKEVSEDIWDGAKNVTEDVWHGTKEVAGSVKKTFTGDKEAKDKEKSQCHKGKTHLN